MDTSGDQGQASTSLVQPILVPSVPADLSRRYRGLLRVRNLSFFKLHFNYLSSPFRVCVFKFPPITLIGAKVLVL